MNTIRFFALAMLCFFGHVASAADDASTLIPYKSVAVAMSALSEDKTATLTEHEGWRVYKKKFAGVYSLWSFTGEGHPAHPAVVRRNIEVNDGEMTIGMRMLCEQAAIVCESLLLEFNAINEALIARQKAASDK